MPVERMQPRAAPIALLLAVLLLAPAVAASRVRGEGRGIPPPPYPLGRRRSPPPARFLPARAGRTSFAVVDSAGTPRGAEHCASTSRRASVVKVMFLMAYLQMLERAPSRARRATTRVAAVSDDPRIRQRRRLGGARDRRAARRSRAWRAKRACSDYAPGVGWWAFTQTSAADQARFFSELARLIPAQFYGYARVPDVGDRAVAELGRPAGRAAALAGLLQDRRAALAGPVQRGRAPGAARASRSPSPCSPTATRRRPTAKQTIEGVAAAAAGEHAVSPPATRRARRPPASPPGCSCSTTAAAPTSMDLLGARRRARPRAPAARRHAARAADACRARPATTGTSCRASATPTPRRSGPPARARGAARRALAAHRHRPGADGARRLLDGRRDELRARPRCRPPVPGGHPRLLRLHPDGRGLGAGPRRPPGPAGRSSPTAAPTR